MSDLINDVRHEVQRGVILMILVRRNLDWIPFSELRAQMARGQGYPLTDSELWFHLRYLAGRNYIETRNPRPGRSDISLYLVRAMPKAVDLLDGRVERDVGIAF
ncbi:MAG TPA: hypothetical protein VGZ29_13685 [Terriglobia bacterium]|nr:hypothetical protein [Terriglobia bacterium]